MRLFLINVFLLLFISVQAQDGSDTHYVKFSFLNQTHVGKTCHIDFGKKSGPFFLNKRSIDTVTINVSGKDISFIEYRVDNGFNNWFNRQYLVALPLKENSSVRIPSFRIDSLTTTKLYVSGYISYHQNHSILDTITPIRHVFSKEEIAQILIKE